MWGRGKYGGDWSSVSAELVSVDMIYISYQGACAAVLQDGTVVTWGDSNLAGDSSSVSEAGGCLYDLIDFDGVCCSFAGWDRSVSAALMGVDMI